MFFIPIKMKWLALVDVAYLVYQMIEGNWASRVVILCSLASTIIFFLATRNYSRFNYREQKRKKEFYRAAGVHPCPGKRRCFRRKKTDP